MGEIPPRSEQGVVWGHSLFPQQSRDVCEGKCVNVESVGVREWWGVRQLEVITH